MSARAEARLPGGFVPDALEAPLAPLDQLPCNMRLQGIANSVGSIHRRLEWLAKLRAALGAGVLPRPESWTWPTSEVLSPFHAEFVELELARYVFGDPGDALKHDRWDVTRGLLRSAGWQEILRIRKLLENLAGLTGVIRKLGRARQTDEFDPSSRVQAQVLEKITTLAPRARKVHVPDMPAETGGVKRSGRTEGTGAASRKLTRVSVK